MTTSTALTLVLGATGKTGSRVASRLRAAGIAVRTAARATADAHFDWDDPHTYAPALAGVERVYLLGPVGRIDFAGQVSTFLDKAETADVGHVTYLSAYGVDAAPPQMATRSVELDLIGRAGLSHTILRPAWFMQNFSETFLAPINGVIAVPTGNGAEAFIDAEDIAAVASATLADPAAHTGAEYTLTGPEAITVADAAAIISSVSGTAVNYFDIDRDEWIAAAIAGGIPAEYAPVLRMLTETIASGHGAQPTGDVEKVTGTAPTSFTDFAHRTAAAWTTEAAR
ncbi:NAD(P)H-binding protein [Nocardia sp. NPDC004604]|uniref:NAD(P)H-binding protein n=1 Tax=Nocardia sp. NPDC004604 TaxID=3157013 RepID=UPI0033B8D833